MSSDKHADVLCHCCGKDLTDPKNAGDLDVEGNWVCRDPTCRAVHEVEMTVTLEDHQTSSYYDNTVTDCIECGVPLTRDQKVERSEGTYCENCAPPLVTDGGTPAEGELQDVEGSVGPVHGPGVKYLRLAAWSALMFMAGYTLAQPIVWDSFKAGIRVVFGL